MDDGLGGGLLLLVGEPELPHPVKRSASEEENNARVKTRSVRRALFAKARITVKVPWPPPKRQG
jgi:hypothetical protein